MVCACVAQTTDATHSQSSFAAPTTSLRSPRSQARSSRASWTAIAAQCWSEIPSGLLRATPTLCQSGRGARPVSTDLPALRRQSSRHVSEPEDQHRISLTSGTGSAHIGTSGAHLLPVDRPCHVRLDAVYIAARRDPLDGGRHGPGQVGGEVTGPSKSDDVEAHRALVVQSRQGGTRHRARGGREGPNQRARTASPRRCSRRPGRAGLCGPGRHRLWPGRPCLRRPVRWGGQVPKAR